MNVFRYFQIKILSLVEEMGGFGILGGGELTFWNHTSYREPHLIYGLDFVTPLRWLEKHKIQHCPYFFLSDSNIVNAYINTPNVLQALQQKTLFFNLATSFMLKIHTYHSVFPELNRRPKSNGFEKVRDLRLNAKKRLFDTFREFYARKEISYSTLRRQLKGEETVTF